MAKISYCLVIALVLLPLYSVLCQDDAWQSVLSQAQSAGISQDTISQATQSAGISQDTIDVAKKAMGDGSAQKTAEDVLDNADASSLTDWVQEIDDDSTNGNTPQTELPINLPDDEEEDNLVEAPENSPTEAPKKAPVNAPKMSPTIAAPKKAPTSAPTKAPTSAP